MKIASVILFGTILLCICDMVHCSVDDFFSNVGGYFRKSWIALKDFIVLEEEPKKPVTRKIKVRKKRPATLSSINIRFLQPKTTPMTFFKKIEPPSDSEAAVDNRIEVPYLERPNWHSVGHWVEMEKLRRMPPFAIKRWAHYNVNAMTDSVFELPTAPPTTTLQSTFSINPRPQRRALVVPHLKTRLSWNMEDQEWKAQLGSYFG